MGSAWGRGVREVDKDDKQSVLSKGRGNMEKEEEERTSWRDEEGPVQTK
jgi:hypothetical protein